MESVAQSAPQNEMQTKIGKMIFYGTCAVSLWFFYWFAGIQCPC
jgi:membrane protein insertase Oxa1/YidC/SpoIIIJ